MNLDRLNDRLHGDGCTEARPGLPRRSTVVAPPLGPHLEGRMRAVGPYLMHLRHGVGSDRWADRFSFMLPRHRAHRAGWRLSLYRSNLERSFKSEAQRSPFAPGCCTGSLTLVLSPGFHTRCAPPAAGRGEGTSGRSARPILCAARPFRLGQTWENRGCRAFVHPLPRLQP